MKKLITAILLLTAILALAACGGSQEPEETETTNMGNPWVDCADLEEAADSLLQTALDNGGKDNISLVLIQDDGEYPPEPEEEKPQAETADPEPDGEGEAEA